MTHTFKTIRDAVEAGTATREHEEVFTDLEAALQIMFHATVCVRDPDWQALGRDWRVRARQNTKKRRPKS